MSESEERMKKILSEALQKEDDWEQAVRPMKETISEEDKGDLDKLVSQPRPKFEGKDVSPFVTGTFLDDLYQKQDGSKLEGIPQVIQIGITGLPSSGKSILIEEVAVKVAQDNKVLLITSEDSFAVENERPDLHSRLKQKNDFLKLDWNKVSENLVVLDTVTFAELRNWHMFAKAYRHAIEKYKVKLVLVDSVTLLETYRGALKNRLQELCRYNQLNGITAIYINQRATEDWDTRSMAGGIGLAHILDSTILIDYGRTYHGDVNTDLGTKRGTNVNFVRVMGNRLGRFDGQRKHLIITEEGFLRKFELGELQNAD